MQLGYYVMWNRGGRKQLEERIAALERAVEGLDSGRRLLTLEWESVFDKLNRTMGRLNARIRKADAVTEPESDEREPAGAAPLGDQQVTGTHGVLSEMRKRSGLLPR